MRGQLASQHPVDYGEYSDLQILLSPAGWYIGTMFTHTSGACTGLVEPGSRESEYFNTRAEAEIAFQCGTWHQRTQP